MTKTQAIETMRKMLVPIGSDENMDNLNALNVPDRPGMERWLAFYDCTGAGNVGRFVERKLIQKDEDRHHYEVRNGFSHCFYVDLCRRRHYSVDHFYPSTGLGQCCALRRCLQSYRAAPSPNCVRDGVAIH
jgi:hypothetical protein